MTPGEQKAFELALPFIEYGLQLALPEVPAPVWVAIFAAVKAGDTLSGTAVRAALADAGITISYKPSDFPSDRNGTFPPADKLEDSNAV